MVSMTGYRDAYKLDIPMKWPRAMATAMVIMNSERKQFRTRYRTTAIDFRINTESSLTNRYGTQQSCMRLVVGRATTFKKRGITIPESRTPTANYQHTGSAGTKHREVHSPIETASSSKRTRGTIDKLDSGNGDDLSKISWIHPIAWIHKAG